MCLSVKQNKNKKSPATKNKSARKFASVSSARSVGRAAGRETDPTRVRAILKGLDEAYPAATCGLNRENPFQLLIATILSAQCTDVRVNEVTKTLDRKS